METTRKIEVFVSNLCPHCQEVIEDFKNNPDKHEGERLIDINQNLANLKRFLKYRDQLDGYNEIKEYEKIGVPSKVIDGSIVEFYDQV